MTIKAVEQAIYNIRGWMDADEGFWEHLDRNEMTTRYVLIDPIIRSLGWDTADLFQCVPEFRKSGQADYVWFDIDGNPAVIIEAKNTGYKVYRRFRKNPAALEQQLDRYRRRTSAKVGVLTNGFIWRLYDLDNSRRKLANQRVEPPIDIYQDNAKFTKRKIREAARTLHAYLDARRFGW